MWTVVCEGNPMTTDIESSADSWLDFAKQVDPDAIKREATFEEVNQYNKERAGPLYSGSETNGDKFEAHRNEAGEVCLFAEIGGKHYEAYWMAGPFEVGNIQRHLLAWGWLFKDASD